MSRLKTTFSNLKKHNEKAFVPFITAGDGGTVGMMRGLVEAGADVIELGVGFSDPMADGEVIARAHQRVVEAGVSLACVLEMVREFRQNDDETAIVLMGYLNPIEVFGYQKFADEAKKVGVDGVLIVDMPPEEARDLHGILQIAGIDLIFLIAQTTTTERLQFLATIASGFVYFVSLKGVTGAQNLDVDLVDANLARVRKYVDLPVGVGFGIKDAKTAKLVSKNADAVIVGSAIVALIEQAGDDGQKMLAEVTGLAAEISAAIKN